MTALLEATEAGYDAQQARAAAEGLTIAPAPVNMYRAEIEAMSKSILEGGACPIDAEAGLRSQLILTACYESARTGQAVTIA